LPAALAPERHDLRQAIGRGMVGLVNEKCLAGKILGQVRAREAVQGRVGTSKSVVERSGLAEIVDDPLYRPESAFPRPLDLWGLELREQPRPCNQGRRSAGSPV
jgi:hypothetical protein